MRCESPEDIGTQASRALARRSQEGLRQLDVVVLVVIKKAQTSLASAIARDISPKTGIATIADHIKTDALRPLLASLKCLALLCRIRQVFDSPR